MKKTRTISDMLQIIHDYIIDNILNNYYHDNVMLYSGICTYASCLFRDYVHDYDNLTKYLTDNLPPFKYNNHSWKPFRPYYRLKWLKKHIELTKNHSQ